MHFMSLDQILTRRIEDLDAINRHADRDALRHAADEIRRLAVQPWHVPVDTGDFLRELAAAAATAAAVMDDESVTSGIVTMPECSGNYPHVQKHIAAAWERATDPAVSDEEARPFLLRADRAIDWAADAVAREAQATTIRAAFSAAAARVWAAGHMDWVGDPDVQAATWDRASSLDGSAVAFARRVAEDLAKSVTATLTGTCERDAMGTPRAHLWVRTLNRVREGIEDVLVWAVRDECAARRAMSESIAA